MYTQPSMSSKAARLLSEALALPEAERAALAADLLASVEPPAKLTDEEWLAEVERRARSARDGSLGIPWAEARRRIEDSLRSK
jgi:putative addiction module component (TIGR02574 family)